MPVADEDVLVQLLEPVEVEIALRPVIADRFEKRRLVVDVRREGGADRSDPAAHQPWLSGGAEGGSGAARVARASAARASAAARSSASAPRARVANGVTG